ncbi:MAG: methyltransferase family protein [Bacteroidales bacterium]|jgi:protein-S-isoprenylcysteine O-methyltransferase Ste14
MIIKIYSGLILVFFIAAFAIRNIRTYLATRQSIRGSSKKLTFSVLISTSIYLLIAGRLTFIKPEWILEADFQVFEWLQLPGLILLTFGFLLGILALMSMKNSWRVGIKYDQKTELVRSGVYAFSRNPYFLSYDILILGYILLFPSLIILGLYMILVMIFHRMILEEEKYLESKHGETYLTYKQSVKRYMTIK